MIENGQTGIGFNILLPCELLRIRTERVKARCETITVSATGAVVSSFEPRTTVGDSIEFRIELPVNGPKTRVGILCVGNVEYIAETTTTLSIKRYWFERQEDGPPPDSDKYARSSAKTN